MKRAAPPEFLLRLFKWFCRPEYHADIEGDLMELYERRLTSAGRAGANWLLLKDVALLFRPGIIRPLNLYDPVNNNAMIKSYLTMGWRSLRKGKLYSTLNVTGLTFGIVCFLLIGLYVYDELTFDEHHVNAERIYRVIEHKNVNGENTSVAAAGFKLAEESANAIPGVVRATRMQRSGRANLVDPENPVNFQETVTIADEHFLQVFDFPLIAGDRKTALKEPNSIVIDEELAKRIFNSVDVIGRNVQFSFMAQTLKITGILKSLPRNSSFTFNSLMSESTYYSLDFFKPVMESDWASNSFSVYVLLEPQANADSVSGKMTRLVRSNVTLDPGTSIGFSLQRLTDVHLHSSGIVDGARNSNVEAIAQGNPMYIKIFSFVAVFVLLIAGINYTNLTTARAAYRIKEIGVRKTIGARQDNLLGQFLVESLLTISLALVLAILVVYLLLPSFNDFVDKQLTLGATLGLRFWIAAIAIVVFVGLLSGSYAAVFLSRLNPVALLKGLNLQRGGDLTVRKGLVIFQFTISTVMIIGTMVLLLQVNYLRTTDLGFNKDLMVVIDVNVRKARSNFEVLKSEMASLASVKNVSVTSRVPGEWKTIRSVKLRNQNSTEEERVSYLIGADKDFLETYEITLLKGRNFDSRNDSSAVLLNETAARMLNIADAFEQVLEISGASDGGPYTPLNPENIPFRPRVIGIVKDFHFQSLREKIQPLIIAYNQNPVQVIDYYSVKISGSDIQGTLNQLKEIMLRNDEQEPFEYHFLDEQLALFYIEDERRQSILFWVAIATVVVACMGLFGLATFSTEQRLKEIGVRKVLGANLPSLVSLLSRDFIKLVLIANLVAFPIAWWATNKWLQQFAYHIEVAWWVFVVAAGLAIMIAFLTVSYQAVKTAIVNPVKILRSE
ncbi:MAG TPA: ABC transporter permease [Chryseosolibacter sp.]|nr:ABC transporter permease [Chryseosolibacter sp.]